MPRSSCPFSTARSFIIRREIRRISLPDGKDLKVTVSAGVSTYEGHPDYEYFINSADAALLRAKQTGRNRVVQHTPAAAVQPFLNSPL